MRVRVSAVFEQGNEILCMKYIYGGKEVFAIPGGGVDKDMPLQEAIVNEWKAELGVKLEVGDVIMLGEAPGTKRHPQTLHVIFAAKEVHGIPKIRPDHTRSIDVAWLPIDRLKSSPMYPDIGKKLHEYFLNAPKSIEFIDNCMERGYW